MGKKIYSGDGWSFNPGAQGETTVQQSLAPQDQRVRLRLDRRKGNKTVTLIENIILSKEDQKNYLKELKQLCGGGGSSSNEHLEIQGDHVDKIRAWLSGRGFYLK